MDRSHQWHGIKHLATRGRARGREFQLRILPQTGQKVKWKLANGPRKDDIKKCGVKWWLDFKDLGQNPSLTSPNRPNPFSYILFLITLLFLVLRFIKEVRSLRFKSIELLKSLDKMPPHSVLKMGLGGNFDVVTDAEWSWNCNLAVDLGWGFVVYGAYRNFGEDQWLLLSTTTMPVAITSTRSPKRSLIISSVVLRRTSMKVGLLCDENRRSSFDAGFGVSLFLVYNARA